MNLHIAEIKIYLFLIAQWFSSLLPIVSFYSSPPFYVLSNVPVYYAGVLTLPYVLGNEPKKHSQKKHKEFKKILAPFFLCIRSWGCL